jgi:hypothetical protein
MGTYKANQADNYGGNGGGGFFSLKNDKDTAVVRFMYNTIEDFVGYAVHEVEVDGKKRYVNCLRSYNEPVSNCPLCTGGNMVKAKAFIHVYDCDEAAIKIWDRGKTFIPKLSSLCARYKPLVSTPFEIERNGKKGDTNTTYDTYPLESDGVRLEDLPDIPAILGSLVLDKSFDELQDFIETGKFDEVEEEVKPRVSDRSSVGSTGRQRQVDTTNTQSARPVRRTMSNRPTDTF